MARGALGLLGRWPDILAFAMLVGSWLLYPILLRLVRGRRTTLNEAMVEIRRAWMAAMLARENRITDAALVGSVISSASFFASTTVLVIGALFGALANAEAIVATLGQFLVDRPQEVWLTQLKVVVILLIFVYGFFKFTWAIRQYNYMIAMIGAAPATPVPFDKREALAPVYARHFSRAAEDFNRGLRAYYFGLAGFVWFLDPLLVPIAILFILVILIRRQTHSAVLDDVQALPLRLR